jgi:hypothetical protein
VTDLDLYRDQVERKADLLRERLLHTLNTLEQRRHDVLDVPLQARRHPGTVLLLGLGALLAMAGGFALAWQRARFRQARLRRQRREALSRLWRHPDWVARKERGILFRIGRAALVAATAVVALAFARRGVRTTRALPRVGPAPARLPGARSSTVE